MSKKMMKLVVTMMVMLLMCACGKKEEYSVTEFEEDMDAMTDALNTLNYLNDKVEKVEEWVEEAKTESSDEAAAENEVSAEEKALVEEVPVEEEPAEETPAEEAPAEESPAEEALAQEENGIDPKFKAAMDSYEAFYREYCDVLKRYNENPTDLTLLTEYMDLMQKSVDMSAKFEAWDENEMNTAELQYYTEVNARVTQMLIEAGMQ